MKIIKWLTVLFVLSFMFTGAAFAQSDGPDAPCLIAEKACVDENGVDANFYLYAENCGDVPLECSDSAGELNGGAPFTLLPGERIDEVVPVAIGQIECPYTEVINTTIVMCVTPDGAFAEIPVEAVCLIPISCLCFSAVKSCVAPGATDEDPATFKIEIDSCMDFPIICYGDEIDGYQVIDPSETYVEEGIEVMPVDDVCLLDPAEQKVVNTTTVTCMVNDYAFVIPVEAECPVPCDDDIDGDGVLNGFDECEDTPVDEIVDPSNGCSIDQTCVCDDEWKNHGAYVKCVAQTSEDFVDLGLITEDEKDDIVSEAAESECGKK
jgi:hypothetical protein